MRFDDSLRTVLASDAATAFGAEATWRQLVDLVGRGKVADVAEPVGRLRELRTEVSNAVRAASARALAFSRPPAALVALFAEDELAIAAPVLRTAALDEEAWLAMLPKLTPRGRSVLRHRRDLAAAVVRGLESFGSVDFILGDERAVPVAPVVDEDAPPKPPRPVAGDGLTLPGPVAPPHPESTTTAAPPSPKAATAPVSDVSVAVTDPAPPTTTPRFEIADLVARIDAFQRDRPERPTPPAAANDAVAAADRFAFRTDAAGTIRWTDAGERAGWVGVSLRSLDGPAFVRRARIAALPWTMRGTGAAAGAWLLDADAVFAPLDGRFLGYRGQGRRAPAISEAHAGSESLRQLVHELRTPTNAIAGFAELIETQLLGPVAPPYREQAGTIRRETAALIGAIDDLDTAARLAGQALDLSAAPCAIEPIVARTLAEIGDARLEHRGDGYHVAPVDDRALERLLRRLLLSLLAVTAPQERLRVRVKDKAGEVAVQIDRPAAFAVQPAGTTPFTAPPAPDAGEPLLGMAFAIDLARDFAAALGGGLTIGAARLTLRLPTALDREVGQAAE